MYGRVVVRDVIHKTPETEGGGAVRDGPRKCLSVCLSVCVRVCVPLGRCFPTRANAERRRRRGGGGGDGGGTGHHRRCGALELCGSSESIMMVIKQQFYITELLYCTSCDTRQGRAVTVVVRRRFDFIGRIGRFSFKGDLPFV